MPYKHRIKTLEESYRLISIEIEKQEKAENKDVEKLSKLNETRNRYLNDLRALRRAQWDNDHERVNFDDDR